MADKKHWPVFVAVLLIALSNAIKGGAGLYYLDERPLNLAASVLLSIGAEVLLFYALMRWSADRTRAAGIYALSISVGATLLNWLFFRNNVEVILSIALAAVGPGIASIGGLVVGEVERTEKKELEDTRVYDIRMAELDVEKARQERLTAMHSRKEAEAQKSVVVPASAGGFDKQAIMEKMLGLWADDHSLSLQAMSKMLEPAYGTLHGYKEELVAAGRLEMRGRKYYPNGRHNG